MKAALIDRVGAIPEYRDHPEPSAGDGEVVVTVEAVAVENVDRAFVAGTHYAAADFVAALPAIRASTASDGSLTARSSDSGG